MKHVNLNPFSHLRPLSLPPSFQVQYYDAPDLIDAACCTLLQLIEMKETSCVVGLDIEYETETTGQGGPGMVPKPRSGHVDLVQLAVDEQIYLFKVCTRCAEEYQHI